MDVQEKVRLLLAGGVPAAGDTVLVALSGGADSMALLDVLLALQPENGYRAVGAIHVNHLLRGAEAERDEQFVREQCERRGVPLTVERVDVAALAAASGKGTEETGREVRYHVFAEAATREAPCFVATAHHADDNAETVLFHLSRGCGLQGLCGIPFRRGHIVRPLLTCTRREIEDYCDARQIPFVTDSSNADVRYSRNRLRHQVMPVMRELNPQFTQAVSRLAGRAAEAEAYLCTVADDALNVARVAEHSYDRRRLIGLPGAVMGTALRRAAELAGARPEEVHVDALRHLLSGGGAVALPGEVRASVVKQVLSFRTETWDRGETSPIIVTPDAKKTYWFGGKTYRFLYFSAKEWATAQNVHNFFVKNALNFNAIQGMIVMRSRQPGDSYHPVGRTSKTLKKLLNEAAVPVEDRERVPVLCDDNGILLVAGYGADCRAAVVKGQPVLLLLPEDVCERMNHHE